MMIVSNHAAKWIAAALFALGASGIALAAGNDIAALQAVDQAWAQGLQLRRRRWHREALR